MKTKKRQKLCYNCEGEVDLDVIVCPFCAADLREEKPEKFLAPTFQSDTIKNLSTEESLYPPHYAPRVREEPEEEESKKFAHVQDEEEPKNSLGSTILLTLGAQLFLIGLFMLVFSSHGSLMLKWNAKFWFLYLLASAPLLIFGVKSINKL